MTPLLAHSVFDNFRSMAEQRLSQSVVVNNPAGLHVRPAEIVARAAMEFESQISLELEGHKIDAKSILHVMTLGARKGSEVVVEALGADARQAVLRMVEVVGSVFEKDQDDQDNQDNTVSQDRAG